MSSDLDGAHRHNADAVLQKNRGVFCIELELGPSHDPLVNLMITRLESAETFEEGFVGE